MKKLLVGLLVAFFAPFLVLAAGSATMSLSAPETSPDVGERFDLLVSVYPNGESIDTVRSVITFDPTVVRAESVSLTGSFNRSTPGNYTDNKIGKVSWGGFTLDGPVTSSGAFAKVTFVAIAQGETKIAISADSRMISAGEERIDISALDKETISVQANKVVDPGVATLVVNSSTHNNEIDWYATNDLSLDWSVLEEESPVTAYFYDFDQSSITDPKTRLSADKKEIAFAGLKDGIYYFHIKGQQGDGRFTETIHRRVNIDVSAPNDFEITANDIQLLEGESLWLTFATTDDTAGVLQYQIAMNESDYQVQQSPLEIADLKPGTYLFRVAALDRAGNVKYQAISIRVYPEGTEIVRPDGYEQSSEINAISSALGKIQEKDTNLAKKLIGAFLLLLVVIGGVAFLKRKKH